MVWLGALSLSGFSSGSRLWLLAWGACRIWGSYSWTWQETADLGLREDLCCYLQRRLCLESKIMYLKHTSFYFIDSSSGIPSFFLNEWLRRQNKKKKIRCGGQALLSSGDPDCSWGYWSLFRGVLIEENWRTRVEPWEAEFWCWYQHRQAARPGTWRGLLQKWRPLCFPSELLKGLVSWESVFSQKPDAWQPCGISTSRSFVVATVKIQQ